MFQNRFDQVLNEVSICTGVCWNDESKICLFARFLQEERDPYLFDRWEEFLEREATEENSEGQIEE